MATIQPASSLTTPTAKQLAAPAQAAGCTTTDAMASGLRCLVFDGDPGTRLLLHQCLACLPSLLIVGYCSTFADTLTFLQAHSVDILLLHVLMPLHMGLDLLRLLLGHLPKLPLLLFASNDLAHAALHRAPSQTAFACFLKAAFITTAQRGKALISTIQSSTITDSVVFSQVSGQVAHPLNFAELCHATLADTAYVSIVVKQLVAPRPPSTAYRGSFAALST